MKTYFSEGKEKISYDELFGVILAYCMCNFAISIRISFTFGFPGSLENAVYTWPKTPSFIILAISSLYNCIDAMRQPKNKLMGPERRWLVARAAYRCNQKAKKEVETYENVKFSLW